MKRQLLKSALITVAGIGLLAGSALACDDPNDPVCLNNAKPFEVAKVYDFGHYKYVSADTPVTTQTFIFSLNGTDGITATDTIISAFLYLSLTDDYYDPSGHKSESIKLNYDSSGYSAATTIDWSTNDGSQLSANLQAYLSSDHTLSVIVAAGVGDFYITGYDLSGCYSTPAAVPEPTTMLLFGTGIAGLAGMARRRKSN